MCLACSAAIGLSYAASMLSGQTDPSLIEQHFVDPIDALSVTLPSKASVATVQYKIGDEWSDWQTLSVDDEQDPTLLESNVVMLPHGVTDVRVRGVDDEEDVQSIVVSDAPVSTLVAATTYQRDAYRILARSEWGADEALRVRTSTSRPTSSPGGDEPTQREIECAEAQRRYPDEFRTVGRTENTPYGQPLRWPDEYSPSVHSLVVHHTAQTITGDGRSGLERMRALYQYHAVNRGWGDIGYHYVVDENGKIYEGKGGGKSVVGGHAYCNNTGTIGIALMGNFEVEQPTQKQMHALQWLLVHLADVYDIDVDDAVRSHGTTRDAIVGHGDLISTACPGYFVRETIGQIRTHVAQGNVGSDIRFPVVASTTTANRAAERRAERLTQAAAQSSSVATRTTVTTRTGLYPAGSTELNGRPGETLRFSMQYTAGSTGAKRGDAIGMINRPAGVALLLADGSGGDRLSRSLRLPISLRPGQTALLQFSIVLPSTESDVRMTIGDWTYDVSASGRSRGPRGPIANVGRIRAADGTTGANTERTTRVISTVPPRAVSSSSSSSVRSTTTTRVPTTRSTTALNPQVRIRLTTEDSVRLHVPSGMYLSGQSIAAGTYEITADGDSCSLGGRIGSVLRIGNFTQTVGLQDNSGLRRYRGIVECRILDGNIALINELPLEDYMMGLAEEPDTEPYEKQRAFAIAARTYAAHYTLTDSRKFPGMPYDGSDSPASFQKYVGYTFEQNHPRWVRAVEDTRGIVLTKNGQIIKPPYFSVSDGRTRSPAEAGWNNFPFAEVFASKPDPWCAGETRRGHGVGMSGCGAEAQAHEGRTGEEILAYYYPTTALKSLSNALASR